MEEFSAIGFLKKHDFIKGLVVSVLAAVLQFVYELVQNQGLSFTGDDWMSIANIAVVAGIGYLIKNLFTDEKGKIGGMF